MARNLVIVESPAKARTIERYLGDDFRVLASYGHVRDLPAKTKKGSLSIDIEHGFTPVYEVIEEKVRRLDDIKKAADMLARVKPSVKKFHSSEYINALANGDICLAVAWAGDSFQARNRARESGNGVDVAYVILGDAIPHIRAGKARVLATREARRLRQLPDVPTVAEAGYPGYEISNFIGISAPAGTASAAVDRLNEAVRAALAVPDVRGRMLNQLGLDPVGSKPAEFGQFVRDEITKWAKIAKAAGIKAAG